MNRPFEVDVMEYPFRDNWLPYRDGNIHYIDEGNGPTVLLLHGNPTWSYLYRNVIKELRGEFRLIAPDYPGFGMSKPPSGYGYTPQEHSEAISDFIRRLDLKDFIIVVQDWGGADRPELRHTEPGSAARNRLDEYLGVACDTASYEIVFACHGGMAVRILASDSAQFLCQSHCSATVSIIPRKSRIKPEESLYRPFPDTGIQNPDVGIPQADSQGPLLAGGY